jgi:hypothetical protein
MRTTMMAGILSATIAVLGANVAEAGTVTVRTPSVVPDADGYAYCRVEARGPRAIEIVAKIVTPDGTDVTEFGTGFRASPAMTGDGYYAEETAGSFHDGTVSCTAWVKGTRRGEIQISITTFDASGNPVVTVQGQ